MSDIFWLCVYLLVMGSAIYVGIKSYTLRDNVVTRGELLAIVIPAIIPVVNLFILLHYLESISEIDGHESWFDKVAITPKNKE